jgi:hypothetical protein
MESVEGDNEAYPASIFSVEVNTVGKCLQCTWVFKQTQGFGEEMELSEQSQPNTVRPIIYKQTKLKKN